jgi:hypothetical protein
MPPPESTSGVTIPGLAVSFCSLLVVSLFLGAAATPNGGGSPSKRSGAPDDGDGSPGNSGTCWDVGCHNSFPLNSGSGSVAVNAPTFYTPGDTLTVEVIVDHPGAARNGFQITARGSAGLPAGEWIPGSTTRLTIGNPNYVTQKLASGVSNWTMQWVAPTDASAGDVAFYFAGNGADGRFNAANDYVYTGETTVVLSTSAGIDEDAPGSFIEAIYPNPASEWIAVTYSARHAVDIGVFDLEGRLRETISSPASGIGLAETTIDVSRLPTGVYVVRLRAGDLQSTQTIFVQR